MTSLCAVLPRAARAAVAQVAAGQPQLYWPRVKPEVEAATARPGRGKQILRTNDVPPPRQAEGPTAVLSPQTTQRHQFLLGHALTSVLLHSRQRYVVRTRSQEGFGRPGSAADPSCAVNSVTKERSYGSYERTSYLVRSRPFQPLPPARE